MTAPPAEPPRVVIDSNVLIPILTYRPPRSNWLVKMWQSRRITPLAREDTLEELGRMLKEKAPTTREYPAQRFVESARRQYEPWCETVPPQDNTGFPECDDPNDQKFFDLATNGEADFLITRDHALLKMNPVSRLIILDDRKFRIIGP